MPPEPNRPRPSPIELGAHQAFLLNDRSAYYTVERGHVDVFAAIRDEHGNILTRKPFVTRVSSGEAFFGAPEIPSTGTDDGGWFVFQAVPSRDAVVSKGEREQLAAPDSFDLRAVRVIDDWVASTSEFIARRGERIPRDTILLEEDPDVPYRAESAVSAHHLDVLWVQADRPVQLNGRPEMEITAGATFPLPEQLWLRLPEETRVSAVHTPAAIVAGKHWEALDRHSAYVLRYANRGLVAERAQEDVRHADDSRGQRRLKSKLAGNLGGLLGNVRRVHEPVRGLSNALQEASAIVAESVGVRLGDQAAPPDHADLFEAVSLIVAPSGIRTRPIRLSPGWERRDGPSFVGFVDRGHLRPVAVVNRGRARFEITDPVSGETAPVDREWAELVDVRGIQFYPPLDPAVKTGLAAVRQALGGKRRDILTVALMGLLSALIALLTPIVTGELLAEIIPRVDVAMWVAALAALLVGALATVAVSIVGSLAFLRIEARIDETLQAAIWNRLLSLPLPFFRRYLAGDLADRANGVSAIRQLLTGAANSSLVSGTFSIFSFLLLFYYSAELALWAGGVTLLMALASWYLTRRQVRHQRVAMETQGAIDGLVFQQFVGLPKIRQANAELHALGHWSRQYARQRREQLSARKWMAGQLTLNAVLFPLSYSLLTAVIWYSLIEDPPEDPFALADFLSFNAAFGQFLGGATSLTATLTTVVTVLPLFERVMPIIKAQPESVGGAALPDVSGRIEFEHVSFRYPSAARDALQDVTFDIRPGDYVAFLGPSGSGKSTLFRLLLGFERPTAGSVLLDGHDLLSLDLRSMRRHFGVVLQDGQIVPDNIYKIIAGEAPLTEAEARDAARMVGFDEDLKALPLGLNTVIAEGGRGLSGGQRQRLLVARALARKPRVLLLDEATSALDNRAQDAVRTALRGLNVTRVLIAHRLSTVVDTDRIYVMQDGRIVETGRYRELLDRKGVLADMASRQIV